jgi:hypothetical protein
MQRAFNPLAGAERLENGTLFYKVAEKDLAKELFDEEKMRREF